MSPLIASERHADVRHNAIHLMASDGPLNVTAAEDAHDVDVDDSLTPRLTR